MIASRGERKAAHESESTVSGGASANAVMDARNRRPVFFNLFQIGFPVTAIVSIGHRVSGVVLALVIPLLAYLLQRSLADAEGYAAAAEFFRGVAARGLLVLVIWALAHHVLAGVRHLLFDAHVGTSLAAARASAWAVFIIEIGVVVLAIGALW